MYVDRYCFDSIYDDIPDVTLEEYPYLVVLIRDSTLGKYFIKSYENIDDNPSTRYEDLSLLSLKLLKLVSVDNPVLGKNLKLLPESFYSELDPEKVFKYNDINQDNFYLPLNKIGTSLSVSLELKLELGIDVIESIYDEHLYVPNSNFEFKLLRDSFGGNEDGNLYDSVMCVDSSRTSIYLHSEKFNAALNRIIKTKNIKTSYVCRNDDEASPIWCHVIACKTPKMMNQVVRCCEKHYQCYKTTMASSAPDPINSLYKALLPLSNDVQIEVGPISNNAQSLQITFDWNNDTNTPEQLRDMICKEIDAGTFYCDKDVGAKIETLRTLPVFINKDNFINKVKLMKRWKDAIHSITINEGL